MSNGEQRRLTHLERCYRLAALLTKGDVLDRKKVAATLGISEANADRHLRAIAHTIPVTTAAGKNGLTSYRVRPESVAKRVTPATVVAACFGASLARLFQGTAFEQRLRDVVGHVLEGVTDVPKYKDRERQFLFVSRGGERALRKNGALHLETIVDGILEHRLLRVKHTRFTGKSEIVRIKPLSLALHEHQVYFLGLVGSDLRIIRFSRIATVFKMKERFDYPSLDDYDPGLIFRDSLGIFIHDDERKGIAVQNVKLRLASRWSGYVETHRWHESQRHSIEHGCVLLELRVRTCPDLERFILGFGEDAEVLEPLELRRKISQRAAGAAARYKRSVSRSTARSRFTNPGG